MINSQSLTSCPLIHTQPHDQALTIYRESLKHSLSETDLENVSMHHFFDAMPVRQGTSPVYNNITDVYFQIETRQAEVITKFLVVNFTNCGFCTVLCLGYQRGKQNI